VIEALTDFPAFACHGQSIKLDHDTVPIPAVAKALRDNDKARRYNATAAAFAGVLGGAV
jgi:hypothetical protein